MKEPVLPSWFVTLNIPLSGETFNLGEEFVNGSIIVQQDTIGPDPIIALSISSGLDTTRILREDLSIEPQNDSVSIGIGLIEQLLTDSLTVMSTEVKLNSLFPNLTVGDSVTIPESTLDSLSAFLTIEAFNGIHINSGTATLRIQNDLPFPIGPNSFTPNGLEMELIDDSLDQNIVELSIPRIIPPGGTDQNSDQIGDIWVYSRVRTDYVLPIAETTTFFVTQALLDTAGFTIELELENLEVDSAYARLKGFEDNTNVRLESENNIKEATIDEGEVMLVIRNDFQADADIQFTAPNFINSGDPLTDVITVLKNTTSTASIPLDNYRISNPSYPDSMYLTLDFSVTYLNAGQFVLITSNDSISVKVETDTIFLRDFEGRFALDSLAIPEFSESNFIDYGKFTPGVLFQDAQLALTLRSELVIENLTLDLNITGYHIDKNGVATHTANLNPPPQTVHSDGSPGNPDDINIFVSGSEVADFLNILPNAIKSSGRVTMEGEARIVQGSRAWGAYSIGSPLRLEIVGLDTIYGDVVTFISEDDKNPYEGITETISQDVIDMGDDLESGALELELVNHTPVGISVLMLVSGDLERRKPNGYFYNTDSIKIIDSLEFIKSDSIPAADAHPQTGYVIEARKKTVSFRLEKDELRILASPPYRVGYAVKVSDSDGVVTLRPIDFVRTLGMAKLIVKIEDD